MHPPDAEFKVMSVTALEFGDSEFDTVICMEVLEHLPPDDVPKALRELRRVAGRRLLMTVPYDEPYPLFHHHIPTGHKQQFDLEKLRTLFPSATAVRLPGRRVDWVLMAEDRDHARPEFTLLDVAGFSRAFGVAPFVWVGAPRLPRALGALAHVIRQRLLRAKQRAVQSLRRIGIRRHGAEPT